MCLGSEKTTGEGWKRGGLFEPNIFLKYGNTHTKSRHWSQKSRGRRSVKKRFFHLLGHQSALFEAFDPPRMRDVLESLIVAQAE